MQGWYMFLRLTPKFRRTSGIWEKRLAETLKEQNHSESPQVAVA